MGGNGPGWVSAESAWIDLRFGSELEVGACSRDFLGRPRGFGLGLVVAVVEGAVAGAVEKARKRTESAWGFSTEQKQKISRQLECFRRDIVFASSKT